MEASHLLTYDRHAATQVRRMQKLVLLASLIGFGLYSVILAPLYTQLDANVLYQETAITYILYYLCKGFELATFFFVFPATVYAIFRAGFLASRSVWITFLAATVAKYVINFAASCIADGNIPSWGSFVRSDLPIMGPNLLMEIGQYAIVLLLAVLLVRKAQRKLALDSLLCDKEESFRSVAFPMKKLLSLKNPVQAAMFWTAIMMLLARLFSHLMLQLTLIIYNGEPDSALIIAFDIITDLLISAALYFVSILLMSGFDKREMAELADKI